MDWTEILITVNTAAVEAVANLVHEEGGGGVVIEHRDNQISVITAYFPVGEATETILTRLENFLIQLEELNFQANARVKTNTLAERNWAEEWKKYYQPIQVGNIYISPSWLAAAPQPGSLAVELDPGMAFGTGIHATTQMCIHELAATVTPGKTMLDLGTGSGILAIVSAKLGAARVDAVDNDGLAIKVAGENARRNNCRINLRQGDAFDLFRQSTHDVVVANIGFSACTRLAQIYRAEQKSCTLILSGFPQERFPEFQEFYPYPLRSQGKDGWSCLVLERP